MNRIRATLIAVTLISSIASASAQTPAGTSISYQGQLMRLGSAVNDSADFRVTLWDAEIDGDQVGGSLEQRFDNLLVIDGIFDLQLDFGANAFGADARWLEIEVRSPHDPSDTLPFVTLEPRQRVTASPYSLHTRGITVDAAGNAAVAGTMAAAAFVGPIAADQLTGTINEAQLPQNTIDGSEIENESLTGLDIANGTLTRSDLAIGAVGTVQIADGAIRGSDVALGTLTGAHIDGPGNGRPFHFQRYGPFPNGGLLDTGFSADLWAAAVVGFRTTNGDIQENGVGDPLIIYPFVQNGNWHVDFDLRSHNSNEGWEFWMMFVDRRFASVSGI